MVSPPFVSLSRVSLVVHLLDYLPTPFMISNTFTSVGQNPQVHHFHAAPTSLTSIMTAGQVLGYM